MPMVGGFLGGDTSQVPVGQSLVNLSWMTDDRENLQVTFKLTNQNTTDIYSVPSDSSGRATTYVNSGIYDIEVIHEGVYGSDEPQMLIAESRGTYNVNFYAIKREVYQVTFQGMSIPSATYSLKDSDMESIDSGSDWPSEKTYSLVEGSYTLEITAFGKTFTYPFEADSNKRVDISSSFVVITISNLVPRSTVTLSGIEFQASSSSISITMLKDTSNYTPSLSSPQYFSGSKVVGYSSLSFIPDSSKNISASFSSYIRVISSSMSVFFPAGKYEIFMIGGGGSGNATGGGGSGQIYFGTQTVTSSGNRNVSIGSGGTTTNTGGWEDLGSNGGPTSISGIRTVGGGYKGGYPTPSAEFHAYTGGYGGAGGGGNAGVGGDGQFGGGGGGYGGGGNGGTYGGGGGSGGDSGSEGQGGTYGGKGGYEGQDGEDGTDTTGISGLWCKGPGKGGKSSGRGGGGGGGYGGNGGGWTKNTLSYTACGGGGYGANGGGDTTYNASNQYGGAGGGGFNGGKGGENNQSSSSNRGCGGGGGYGSTRLTTGGGGYGYGAGGGPKGANGCVVLKYIST